MSNNTWQGNETALYTKYPVFALIFGSITALGLPLNALSLWILLCRHSLTSPSTVFMVNLAVSDLLLVITLPMRVYFYASGTWQLGSIACVCTTMLFRNNIRSSSIFITFISVDRLLAVVYPLRSRHLRTSANAWRAVVLLWLFVLGLNLPESVAFSKFLNGRNDSYCFEFRHISNRPVSTTTYVHVALVLTMLAVNLVCTAMVSWTLRRHLNESSRVNNKVNVMVIFIMNLTMFTVLFLPVSLIAFSNDVGVYLTPLTCLASCNCCLDPVLYYFYLDGFWKKEEDVEISLARE
ncbi:lysophosphatidic acid receptor 5b [Hippoglossus hippoglossus]|uniref:lysophosphatidic acid receptor 5b n=1 Tax=Hippoglossus hippoglossus TaxID=8267 RepID=UPI00148E72B1|nr:lysophosphatidic acid receptor 5b [Hippoglossus hippoglossus]XP_035010706.1 lysophosphatidic acid receptor 5b [Hippoglossus stenolepis]